MKSALRVFAPVLVWTAACAPGIRPATGPQIPTRPTTPAALEQFGRTSLAFEQDEQTPDVYVSRTPTYTLRVAPTWAEIQPLRPRAARVPLGKKDSVRMHLLGANEHPAHVADAPLPGTVNYLRGSDSARWRTGVATYARVRYGAVYPGIDLVYYGSPREIEYDFVVAPGASVDRIALGFDGTATPTVNAQGDLELTQASGAPAQGREPLVFRAPRAYQTIDGREQTVAAHYRLDGEQVRLTVGDYDRTQPLVIDPILSYSISLGGTDQDEGNAVAVDAAGNVYVAGFTHSSNYPASGSNAGAFDLFLTKLNPTGTVVLSSSYIGGSANDEMRGLAIDGSGNAYLTGVTRSPNFPTVNALQGTLKGLSDAFVVKISTTGGGMQFSTYLGGDDLDEGTGVAVDGSGNVYVTGTTRSANFPTASAFRGSPLGNLDSFVTKLNPSGTSLSYSSYLGGSLADNAHGIAVSATGFATVVGATNSTDFVPILNAVNATPHGLSDAFVTRLTPSGSPVFSTLFGGGGMDSAQSVVIDEAGRPIVTGSTDSADFPTVNAAQGTIGGSLDAFVTGFPAAGDSVWFSTFLGGSGSDRGRAITRDTANRLYVVGQTFSANFPVVNPVQEKIGGNRDTFVAMFSAPNSLTYSTYLGGSNNDDGLGIAADALGRAYVTGATMFAWPDLAGESDAFVLRVSSALDDDPDGDGMPTSWETKFANDLLPNEDPDGDGLTNLQEYQAGTHPLGFFTRYLAEGATGSFFDTQLALFNPGSTSTVVLVRFQQEGAAEVTQTLTLPAHSRQTIMVDTVAGLENSSFSTVLESDAEVTLDRTMTWDAAGFGSSAETAAPAPSMTWYLAEGATHGRFDLYYLLQNPNTATANVTVRYLRPFGQPAIEKVYQVAPRSRSTINVDGERFNGVQQLIATDVSAKITSDVPILAERAMYQTVSGRIFSAGHESMGVTAPSTSWFFAEGATGTFFDMYLLLANPNKDLDAAVTIDYLFAGGGVLTKTVDVTRDSRRTLGVDGEDPLLLDAAFSMRIKSTAPIIAERAMWWPSPNWYEAHNSAGTVVTSPRWAVAEGEVGGTRKIDTFVLIANTSAFGANVLVSVFYEDQGISSPKMFFVPANSRFNVNMRLDFPESLGRRFSVLVEGLGDTPPELVVERAMYSDSGTTVWAAGTNALGSPLFPADTFIITEGGTFPRRMVVAEGTRVRFINRDTKIRFMNSDPHPVHTDCPEIGTVDRLEPGQTKLTGNMVIDAGRNVCGFHDHEDPANEAISGTIIIRP